MRCLKTVTLRGLFIFALLLHAALLVVFLAVKRPTFEPRERPLRVAVCFFGLTRSLRYTVDSIRSNILDELTVAGIEYTIYVHTHNVSRVYNPRAKEFNVRIDPSLYKLLRPNKAMLESPVDWSLASNQDFLDKLLMHGDAWQEKEHISLKNLVNQLKSLEQLTSMWTSSFETYDAVLYSRSDVWYFNKLDIRQVLEAASARPHPVIWTPDFHLFEGLNDRFAFGNPAGMKLYGNRIKRALDYAAKMPFHAESFLKHVVTTSNITVHKTSIVFTRIRGDGLVVELPMVEKSGKLDTKNVRPVFAYRMTRTSLGFWRLVPA